MVLSARRVPARSSLSLSPGALPGTGAFLRDLLAEVRVLLLDRYGTEQDLVDLCSGDDDRTRPVGENIVARHDADTAQHHGNIRPVWSDQRTASLHRLTSAVRGEPVRSELSEVPESAICQHSVEPVVVHATQLRSTAYRDAWMAIGREHKNFSLRVVPNCLTEQRSEIVHCGVDACSATGEEGDSHDWSEEDPAGGGTLQPQDVRAVAVATMLAGALGAAWHWDFREDDDDYYSQPRALFQLMKPDEQQRLFENTARAIGGAPKAIQLRHIGNCLKCDPAYGAGVAKALDILFEGALEIKNRISLQNVIGDERLEKAEEVIRETTAQLIVGIRNTLNMYDVDHADSTISGIILTGTGARLIGLPPVLASSINKMVRIGDPFIRFKLSKEVERQNIVAHAVDLGGVLGLVIGKKPR